jgi:AraC-like DNA-binding protein
MIQTLIAKPDPVLGDCIRYYAIREFDCFTEDLVKPLCAKNEVHFMFLINSKMADFRNNDHCKTPYYVDQHSGPDCVYSGLLTSNQGSIVFRGHVKLLTIHFKAVGFYCLFNLSPLEITDCLGLSADLLPGSVLRLHEQLQEAATNEEIFRLADSFLLSHLRHNDKRKNNDCLKKVTEFLLSHPAMYAVDQLAYAANMTLKTFERKFQEQVGVKPKLFERLHRFNRALEFKSEKPNASWTEISFLTGYYDQNHFIKEFSEFAGMPPVSFFKNSPPPLENISLEQVVDVV